MSDDRPKDWFRPTTFDSGERGYWITREGVIFVAISTDGEVATQAKVEIVNFVAAWYRGEFFPRSAASTEAEVLLRRRK